MAESAADKKKRLLDEKKSIDRRIRAIDSQEKKEVRKARNHKLIFMAAYLEKMLVSQPKSLLDDAWKTAETAFKTSEAERQAKIQLAVEKQKATKAAAKPTIELSEADLRLI
jgi:hypothetical protein